jgi:hypothetical protein
VKFLRTWYTDLRDFNTKLMRQKSGDATRQFTEREKWVMDRFAFLRCTVRHRRAPVKSVSMEMNFLLFLSIESIYFDFYDCIVCAK